MGAVTQIRLSALFGSIALSGVPDIRAVWGSRLSKVLKLDR